MLKRTYDRIYGMFEKAGGYLPTRLMLNRGVSTIHIKELLDNGDIEKISHGNYWGAFLDKQKPKNYKMIEACMTNSKSVICGSSACYHHGLIKNEPDKLYVATMRTDRAGMQLGFPISRHYFSVNTFNEDVDTFTDTGIKVRVYGLDRSVCDCIRLEREIGVGEVDKIVKAYKKYPGHDYERCLEYADKMRVGQMVRERLSI